MGEWLTTAEAATYASVGINTIRDALERGDLSGIKLTPGSTRSQWRLRAGDIDTWLEQGRVGRARRPRRQSA